jgi:hypothetical protein
MHTEVRKPRGVRWIGAKAWNSVAQVQLAHRGYIGAGS